MPVALEFTLNCRPRTYNSGNKGCPYSIPGNSPRGIWKSSGRCGRKLSRATC